MLVMSWSGGDDTYGTRCVGTIADLRVCSSKGKACNIRERTTLVARRLNKEEEENPYSTKKTKNVLTTPSRKASTPSKMADVVTPNIERV
ncbi:hypothetical protein GOP47_0005297 [Adiantum capillus-veneris]|uniref:Uncharacterized protein n=1 Tax=Adiantum capillus-veneris TaxID=13818 RepID=A0A9D4V5Z3_ADICA|nr:hypothetical protein GOP47_0005297 [Adiantum capillus-veneris]